MTRKPSPDRSSVTAALRRIVPFAAAAVLAVLPGSAAADPISFSGSLGHGCTYKVTGDTGDSSFQIKAACPDIPLSATASGTYDKGGVDVTTLDYSVLGVDGSSEVGLRLDFPADAGSLANLFGDSAGSVVDFALGLAPGLVSGSSDFKAVQAGGLDHVLKTFGDGCQSLSEQTKDIFCPKDAGTAPDRGKTRDFSKPEQREACPSLQSPLPKIFVVCVPMYVGGDAAVPDDKDLIVVPGGALIAVPVGTSLGDLTTPVLHTKGAIVIAGGVIGGWALKIQAGKDVAISGAIVAPLHSLEVQAASVDLGHVELKRVLEAVPPAVQSWFNDGASGQILRDLTSGKTLTYPALLYSGRVTFNVKGQVTVSGNSSVSASGLGSSGGSGGPTPLRDGIGGAANDYGGSYGGYGGYDDSLRPAGPGTSYGNPFDPMQPGAGGAGDHDAGTAGSNGGGVIVLSAGSLALDGALRANGDDVSPSGLTYASGGGGAGGSVNIRVKDLTGKGILTADGGSFTSSGLNPGPGNGGGGRIAIRYQTKTAFKGSVYAWGGHDFVHASPATGTQHPGAGGAGTVYWLRTGGGPRTLDDDQLVVDGGGGSFYPPPTGTPIMASWGSAKRSLVVSGRGQVWATRLNFGRIALSGGAVITTAPGDERDGGAVAPLPAEQRLEIHAGELDVAAGSRIDMTARGYAGGGHEGRSDRADDPGRGPSGHASTGGAGGSHGGRGGLAGDVPKPGAPYDGAQNPSLPGGGGSVFNGGHGTAGGGVLVIDAAVLHLDGDVMADGKSGTGPSRTDPTDHVDEGGMGAGGAVQVRVRTLAGNGRIQANGGSSCLRRAELLPGVRTCDGGTGGGGGGGRVLVVVHDRSGWRGKTTADGGWNHAVADRRAHGQAGTVVIRPG